MKNYLKIAFVVLLATLSASCNYLGNKIPEIKLYPVKVGKLFQYIDREGKIVINPQFNQATVFRNGLALVQSSDNEPKWGYISEDGKYVIMAKYKDATIFSEDLAWVVSENSAPTAINSKGEIKITLQNAQTVRIFKEGLAAFCVSDSSGQKWGFIDKGGKIKINPQFSRTGNFNNGKCAVANHDGKYGYIDATGKILINFQFDLAKEFINGKAVVFSGNKAGLIDNEGKYIINPQFTDMTIDGDNFLIQQEGKFGWCDKDGKIIINPQFSSAFPFKGNELAPVHSEKNACYIDKEGKIIINPQFDEALPFNGKLALVVSSSKIGFIDKQGKYVINPQFDGISPDFVQIMSNSSSVYESANSDYFDIGSIVNRIKKDITGNSIAGMNFSTPLSAILAKYNKSVSDFLASGNQVIKQEPISNNILLNMSIGFPGYNQNNTPNVFTYYIIFKNTDSKKLQLVLKAFETAFTGFTKDTNVSTSDLLELKNEYVTIRIYTGSIMRIEITPFTNLRAVDTTIIVGYSGV